VVQLLLQITTTLLVLSTEGIFQYLSGCPIIFILALLHLHSLCVCLEHFRCLLAAFPVPSSQRGLGGWCGVHVQRVKLHKPPAASSPPSSSNPKHPSKQAHARTQVAGGNATPRGPTPARWVPSIPGESPRRAVPLPLPWRRSREVRNRGGRERVRSRRGRRCRGVVAELGGGGEGGRAAAARGEPGPARGRPGRRAPRGARPPTSSARRPPRASPARRSAD
jgi:hypothetical protein